MKRTQDLEPTYWLNGALYIFDREYVGRMHNLYSDKTYTYIMSSKLFIHIDTQNDFYLAYFNVLSKSN